MSKQPSSRHSLSHLHVNLPRVFGSTWIVRLLVADAEAPGTVDFEVVTHPQLGELGRIIVSKLVGRPVLGGRVILGDAGLILPSWQAVLAATLPSLLSLRSPEYFLTCEIYGIDGKSPIVKALEAFGRPWGLACAETVAFEIIDLSDVDILTLDQTYEEMAMILARPEQRGTTASREERHSNDRYTSVVNMLHTSLVVVHALAYEAEAAIVGRKDDVTEELAARVRAKLE